jgi:hydrogenase nickel incorporation protein HypA/HybF
MHELAVAESLVSVVETRAAEYQAARVTSVRLRIGEASGIVVDSLAFCFEMLASMNPMLAGAQLACEIVPHRALCRGCDAEFPVEGFVARCPTCGEWSSDIVSGTELQIVDMEIEDAQETG